MERRIFIEELVIKNILNCDYAKLCFTIPESTYFVMTHCSSGKGKNNNTNHDQSAKISPVTTAIQLICSAKYASINSLTQFDDIQNGSVRMIFHLPYNEKKLLDNEDEFDDDTPCTSQQALERQRLRLERENKLRERNQKMDFRIIVTREFYNHPEHVTYCINGKKNIMCSLSKFHGRFFTTLEYILPNLTKMCEKCNGDWIDLLKTNIPQLGHYSDNPFEKFIQLFMGNYYKNDTFMTQLTNSFLAANSTLLMKQKEELIKILKSVRNVFEYITCEEYSVFFIIPCHDSIKYIDIQNVNVEQLDFNQIKTCIQLKMGPKRRRLLWTDVQHGVQDLLLIAFQMVMSVLSKQPILCLSTFDSLQAHIAYQFTTAAYVQQHEHSQMNWTWENYLQRIIKSSNTYNLTMIMDYPGGLPVKLQNVNIIKCKRNKNGKWIIKNATASSNDDITPEELLNSINDVLKSD